jgi:hypothetical protein
MVWLPIAVGV